MIHVKSGDTYCIAQFAHYIHIEQPFFEEADWHPLRIPKAMGRKHRGLLAKARLAWKKIHPLTGSYAT